MRAGQTVSAMSDKLRDTARDAGEHLYAAGETVNEGLRETAGVAAEGLRQSAKSAETAIEGAAATGKDIYHDLAQRASGSIASVDAMVARHPVGALVAALGFGLVVGLMARK